MSDLDLQIVDLARDLLVTTVIVAGPALAVGMCVGVIVSLFQALTSVQEQTLSLVPKMLAVMTVTLLLLAPALELLRDFTARVLNQIVEFGLS
ncbi:MAG: flagellar biosynthetic protein FliQ [Planctomycetota bacterium]